jgi:hypothetical protein
VRHRRESWHEVEVLWVVTPCGKDDSVSEDHGLNLQRRENLKSRKKKSGCMHAKVFMLSEGFL